MQIKKALVAASARPPVPYLSGTHLIGHEQAAAAAALASRRAATGATNEARP